MTQLSLTPLACIAHTIVQYTGGWRAEVPKGRGSWSALEHLPMKDLPGGVGHTSRLNLAQPGREMLPPHSARPEKNMCVCARACVCVFNLTKAKGMVRWATRFAADGTLFPHHKEKYPERIGYLCGNEAHRARHVL